MFYLCPKRAWSTSSIHLLLKYDNNNMHALRPGKTYIHQMMLQHSQLVNYCSENILQLCRSLHHVKGGQRMHMHELWQLFNFETVLLNSALPLCYSCLQLCENGYNNNCLYELSRAFRSPLIDTSLSLYFCIFL